MKAEKFRILIFRFVFTVLLSVGFLFPVLGVAGYISSSFHVIPVVMIVALILTVSGISRTSAIFAAVLLPAGVLVWLFGFSGLESMIEVARAFTLQLRGLDYAIPLVSDEAVFLLAVLISLLSFPMTLKKSGSWPSLLACSLVALLLWLKNAPEYIVYLLPALIASFTILLLDRHEEIRILRVMPFVLLIVIAAFLITPMDGIVSSEMKNSADELRQSIMDRLFYTEPRDVFSLASEGFYPQGSGQLGGPVNPSDHPVMQVSSPRKVYLRGVVLNEYNGRSWKNTVGGRRYLWDSRSQKKQRVSLFDQELPSTSFSGQLVAPVTVSVRMLTGNASTIFLPQRVRELYPGGDLVAYFSSSSEIFSTRNLQIGDTWSVEAPLFVAGDPGLDTLILSVSDSDDPQYDSVLATYTSLPEHLEQPVTDLAMSITSGLTDPYSKAFAIQSWLSRNCRYTLDVAEQPADIDFVTNFLINTKEGYCTYFASAMTVLCRLCGLPARYIEGYLAEPDDNGEALVTGKNAHAWAEVYFNGFGWLTFDASPRLVNDSVPTSAPTESVTESPDPVTPTPDPGTHLQESVLPDEISEETPPLRESDTPEPEKSEPPISDDPDLSQDSSSQNDSFPWWILIPVLLFLFISVRIITTSPDYQEKHSVTNRERFNVRTADINRLLRAAGVERRPGETPMSFTRRLDNEDRFNVSLSAFGECISLCLYGNVEPIDSDIALIRDTAVLLRSELSVPFRFRYLCSRIFSFRKSNGLI